MAVRRIAQLSDLHLLAPRAGGSARERFASLGRALAASPRLERARGALALLEAASGLEPVPPGQGEAEALPPAATPSGPPA